MAPWRLRRLFDATALTAIEDKVRESETQHSGEICVAIEATLDLPSLLRNESAEQRALHVFSQLRVWDTADNNGVLIFLLLADRDVTILADRGIHAKVGAQAWEDICRSMEKTLAAGRYTEAILAGVAAVGAHLQQHFPAAGQRRTEPGLDDRPRLM
jgi:uncharacterized membrane protein